MSSVTVDGGTGGIALVALCAMSTFFPYFNSAPAATTVKYNAPLNFAVDGQWFDATSLAIILLAVPFAADTIIDEVASFVDPRAHHADRILLLAERVVLLVGLVLPCAAAFLPTSSSSSSLFFACSQEFCRVAVFGALWSSFSRQSRRAFPRVVLYVGMVAWTLGSNLATVGEFALASRALRIVGGGAFYLNMVVWLVATAVSYFRKTHDAGDNGLLYRFAFVGFTLVSLLPAMAGAWAAGDAASYTEAQLTTVHVGYILFELQLLVFFMRKAKCDGTVLMVRGVVLYFLSFSLH